MAELRTTPKNKAVFEPQYECEFFSENHKSYECGALDQCYCCLEAKPCSFYKGSAPQTKHEGFYATNENGKGRKKVLPKATMMAMQADYDRGMSWKAISLKYNISTRQITDARAYYQMPFEKRRRNHMRVITDADLDWAVKAHDEDGMDWNLIAKKLGFTRAAIREKLRRDADRGIYHRSTSKEDT